jgi:hypothetical protein
MEFSASEKGVRFMRNRQMDEIIRRGRGGSSSEEFDFLGAAVKKFSRRNYMSAIEAIADSEGSAASADHDAIGRVARRNFTPGRSQKGLAVGQAYVCTITPRGPTNAIPTEMPLVKLKERSLGHAIRYTRNHFGVERGEVEQMLAT